MSLRSQLILWTQQHNVFMRVEVGIPFIPSFYQLVRELSLTNPTKLAGPRDPEGDGEDGPG